MPALVAVVAAGATVYAATKNSEAANKQAGAIVSASQPDVVKAAKLLPKDERAGYLKQAQSIDEQFGRVQLALADKQLDSEIAEAEAMNLATKVEGVGKGLAWGGLALTVGAIGGLLLWRQAKKEKAI